MGMNKMFQAAYRRQGCEWLSWLGQPMAYDTALFVERDRKTVDVENRVKRELSTHPSIFSTEYPTPSKG
jgi:hypothetical protein